MITPFGAGLSPDFAALLRAMHWPTTHRDAASSPKSTPVGRRLFQRGQSLAGARFTFSSRFFPRWFLAAHRASGASGRRSLVTHAMVFRSAAGVR
jgi:hypothetical protein